MKKCFYTGSTNCIPGHLDDAIKNALERRYKSIIKRVHIENMSKEEVILKIMSSWRVNDEMCEIKGCKNIANRISSTETKYIVICDDCWHEKYKK